MVSLMPVGAISAKRGLLCSRENAVRVASRCFDNQMTPVSIIRTGNPFQPFRVSTAPSQGDHVELVMVA